MDLSKIDMNKAKFQDNPFWRNDEKTEATAILRFPQSGAPNGMASKVIDVDKTTSDGSTNPLWVKLMREVPREKIDEFTEFRKKRKVEEHNEKKYREQAGKRAKELETLFSMKLRAFEIDAVKTSQNRKLRSKLRSSTNELELQAYVTAFVLEELQLETEKESEKSKGRKSRAKN